MYPLNHDEKYYVFELQLSLHASKWGSSHTAGSHRKPIVGLRDTVTMGNDFSAKISATRGARGLKFGPHATHASLPPESTPLIGSLTL